MSSENTEAHTGNVCLRPYQIEAIRGVNERIAAGVRRILLVAPTGSGKTTVAGAIIREAVRQGRRVLFIAHRRELILQCYRRLLQMLLDAPNVGILMGRDRRYRPSAAVQIASIDTLRNRPKPAADLVITDECHRATSRSHVAISAHYDRAIQLGLTATPFRADGKGLASVYDELLVIASPRQLIAEGYLVEPRVLTVPSKALPDLSAVRMRGGDYDEGALADAVDRKALVGNIVEHWQKHASDHRTVVFAASVSHSQHIAERFRQAGIAAEHLDGTTPSEQRDAILARLERGETRVVASVGVLAEGWDCPSVKCAILARPTKSTGLYLQQAGRILRPYGEQRAIILDHAGCALEHGLPHDDREYCLTQDVPIGPKNELKAPRVRVCEYCYAILPAATTQCPECGKVPVSAIGVPKEVSGELREITESPLVEQRAEWDRLCAVAASKNYKPGWVAMCFKEKYGRPPPRSFPAPRPWTTDDRQQLFQRLIESEKSVEWAALRYRLEVGSAPPPQQQKGLQ